MKPKTASITIIVFNVLLLSFALLVLYQEYQRVGKFQWVDAQAIEEQEELFQTPILFSLALLGLTSTARESLRLSSLKIQQIVPRAIAFILSATSNIYGTILMFISSMLMVLLVGNIENHHFERGFFLFTLILLLVILSVGIMGGLIVYNNIRNHI